LSAFNASSASVYTVLVTPINQGSVTLDVASNVAIDSVSNGNTAAAQHTVDFDSVVPSVMISGSASVNAAFTATVTFSEDVIGFVIGDITVSNASLSAFSASSASEYTVLVTPTTDGALTLDVSSSVATDAAANNNSAATQFSASFDNTSPTVSITDAVADPHNAAFTATVTFSEDVTGFDVGDISAGNASLSAFNASSASVYTVLVTPINQGSVTLDVAADAAIDGVNNGNLVASQLSLTFDDVAPTLGITNQNEAVNGQFVATFTFSEAVTGFSLSDITSTNATFSDFTTVSASIYTVMVEPTAAGDLVVDVSDDAAQDNAGNDSSGDSLSLTYDPEAPSVEIQGPTGPVSGAFLLDIVFSEEVSGFALSDVSATNATVGDFVTNSAAAYAVTITPIADGSITIDVGSASAVDAANNDNTAALQFTIENDSSSPDVQITGPEEASISTEFTATITFNSNVIGFTESDILVTNAVLSNFTADSGAVYSVLVTPSADGEVTLNIPQGAATDLALNANTIAEPFSIVFDATGPTLTINGPAEMVNDAFTISFVFDESVSGFELSDITVVNATISDFTSVDEANYTGVFTPIDTGLISINVAADIAVDGVENGNSAATEYQVTAELGPLTVSLSGPEISNSPFTSTILFNRSVSGFTDADFTVSNASLSEFTAISAASYTVLVTPVDNGDVSILLPANTVVDAFDAGNEESNLLELKFDDIAPTVESTLPEDDANIGLVDFEISLVFSEVVTAAAEGGINTLELFEVGSDVAIQSFTLPSAEIVLEESTLRFNTPLNLEAGSYYINISAGALVDEAENPFDGIVDETSWSFVVSDQHPVANDDEATLDEDTSIVIELLENDTDVEGKLDLTSVAISTEPSNGEVSIDEVTGDASYTPSPNFSGQDTFTYTVSDEDGQTSEIATVTITINELNDGPMAADDNAFTLEDASVVVDVLANDLDIDGGLDSSTLEVVSAATNGTTTIVNGRLSYQPDQNYFGSDSLTYRVQDNVGVFSNVAKLTINVTAVVDLPLAANDSAVSDEDTLTTIELLMNDSGVDGDLDPTSVVITTQPSNGSVTVNLLGDVNYQPNLNFFGEDSFNYTVADINGTRSAEATSQITILSVNDVPQITSTASLTSNPLSVYSYQLQAEDADGDTLVIQATQYPDWLMFDGIDTLSGTPNISDVGQSFNIVMTVSDNNILQPETQSFDLVVTAPELSDLLLSQETSENPVLLGSTLELNYVVLNQGPNIALLDTLTIELSGTSGITTLPDNCLVAVVDSKDVVSCDVMSELAVEQSIDITLSLPVTLLGNGEIQSKMSLTQQVSDLVLENEISVIVAEEIIDEEGDLLTPSQTADTAFGDLNNDGFADLVVVNSGNQANQILFNDGSGQFVLAQIFGDGSNSRAVALIDLDNDNDLDIVVANTGMSASGYYLNQGDGSIGDIVELGEMLSTGVSIADFNGDGLADIVFANGSDVGSMVFLQPFDLDIIDGAQSLVQMSVNSAEKALKSVIAEQESYTPIELTVAKDASAVSTGDYNGDGFADIVVGYNGASLELFLNDGNGNFTSLVSSGISDVAVITTADINDDGVDDIFVSYPNGNGVIFGAFNTTSESLSNVHIISRLPARGIAVADINENGSMELILVNNPGGITTYSLNSSSEFVRSALVIAARNSDGAALADIDGDGDIDIVITSEDDTVADEILFNQGNGRFGAQTVDLAVSLSVPTMLTKEVYYTTDIVISNIGIGAASNLVVNFEVVNGLIEFLNDGTIDCQLSSTTQVRCTIEQLAAGAQLPLAMTIKGIPDTTVIHNVSISNDRLDNNVSNNQASAETVIKLKSNGGGSMTFYGLFLLTLFAFYRNQKLARYRCKI
jgi:hypothetical protein